MIKMNRLAGWSVAAALALAATGCVPQEKYNALKLDRDRLYEQLTAAQADSQASKAELDALRKQLADLNAAGGNSTTLLSTLTAQNADLQRQLADLTRKYEEALGRVGNGGEILPPDLSNALKTLAAQNPDIMEFDPARGIVRFKSDITFASGDASLTARGREVIDRLSGILNQPSTSAYELVIAGHTDNQRVAQAATVAKGHKDNWYLSAHRSISVVEEMLGHSISPQRVAVTGYGEFRPIASNASAAGREKNRRVELVILPTTVGR